jgi:hypothetical protein
MHALCTIKLVHIYVIYQLQFRIVMDFDRISYYDFILFFVSVPPLYVCYIDDMFLPNKITRAATQVTNAPAIPPPPEKVY